jgi:hypothetical protein
MSVHAELSQQLEFAVRERARLAAELEAAQNSAEKSVDMLNNRIKGLLSEVEAARNAKSRAVTNLGSLTVGYTFIARARERERRESGVTQKTRIENTARGFLRQTRPYAKCTSKDCHHDMLPPGDPHMLTSMRHPLIMWSWLRVLCVENDCIMLDFMHAPTAFSLKDAGRG